jgi:hypothetical protein
MVYELARDLNMTNKILISKLSDMDISVKSHMSSLEDVVVAKIKGMLFGKKGKNVRLASKLTGWQLDVKNKTRFSGDIQTGFDSLVTLPGVGISLADALFESGFYTAEEISHASIGALMQIRGIGEFKAAKLMEAASMAVREAEDDDEEIINNDITRDDILHDDIKNAAFVSCDIIGHGREREHSIQLQRIQSINDHVRRVCGRPLGQGVVWASGGDGGHVAFLEESMRGMAVLLIRDLFLWAQQETERSESDFKLRLTAHFGPVSTIHGADERDQLALQRKFSEL